jgi:lipopolysaccharide export system protein LptA
MVNRAGVLALATALALALGGSSASAQKTPGPPNALQGFSQNREEPVRIRAATLEVREKEQQATFTGDVHVVQGDTELRCKVLVIFYDEEPGSTKVAKAGEATSGGQREIRRIDAKGGVTVTQKDQNAIGDTATFDMKANTVTLIGNVVVTKNSDVIRGPRLVVDLTTGVSKMDAGRVEGLFQRTPERK